MNPHITKALKSLENANYSGYFEEMDKVEISKLLKPIYAEHKSKFMQGLRTYDFSQILETFAREVDKALSVVPPVAEAYDAGKAEQTNDNVLQNTSKPNYEAFKQELLAILAEKAHLGIVDILEKIEKTLAYEQYNRTDWVSINSKKSPITLEILSATLVESTKGLINSIKS